MSDSPNVSTTPITTMGCRQCLPISVFQLKGKHCWKPYCCVGVVGTFGLSLNSDGFKLRLQVGRSALKHCQQFRPYIKKSMNQDLNGP